MNPLRCLFKKTIVFYIAHSLVLPQPGSDNDVAYSIMGVNSCVAAAAGGRVESADVSSG